MRAREVDHVDVIAHARTVRGRVVVAVNGQLRELGAGTKCDIEKQRDQVGLGLVMLTAAITRARRIEVAEADGAQTMGTCVPRERLLERELGLAVGVRRSSRRLFVDRLALGVAIDRGRRREHQLGHTGLDHRVEQPDPCDEVVAIVRAGPLHRLANQRIGGHVHDRIEGLELPRAPVQQRTHAIAVAQIDAHQRNPGRERCGVALAEIIEHDHVVRLGDELLDHDAADVPGATRHEHAHQSASKPSATR